MEVTGKIAIVTGASMGIGEATARLLTAKGAKVAMVARNQDRLEVLAKELPGSHVFPADMSKPLEIRQMVQKVAAYFGTIDILVNNAGRGYDASVEKLDIETYHNLFDLDVVGPLVSIQEVAPLMRKTGGGVIVNISSGTALMALPNMGGYSSLKRALVGISLTAREELKKENIMVSLVYPYITRTNFERNTIKGKGVSQEWAGEGHEIPEGDSPEHVSEKILEAITTGKAEVFAHEWMKGREW